MPRDRHRATHPLETMKIITGGQTGVDRAALDAALEMGVPCGGSCPRGRLAEDGRIPDRYPLREFESDRYEDRTRQNVRDSDATVIIAFGDLYGGSLLTRELCEMHHRPCLVLDADDHTPEGAAARLRKFVDHHHVHTLNVAGPRASHQPGLYAFVHQMMRSFLANL